MCAVCHMHVQLSLSVEGLLLLEMHAFGCKARKWGWIVEAEHGVSQVMVNRDGVLTIKGERKFEVRKCMCHQTAPNSWHPREQSLHLIVSLAAGDSPLSHALMMPPEPLHHCASRGLTCSVCLLVREQETEGDDKSGFRRVERAFGEFVRRFQLPDNTDPEHISAKVENGARPCSLRLLYNLHILTLEIAPSQVQSCRSELCMHAMCCQVMHLFVGNALA